MRRVLFFICASTLLAGCDAVESTLEGFSLFDREAPGSRDPVKSVMLSDAQVMVTGPFGFCVDPRLTRSTKQRATAVFGSCAGITGLSDQDQPYEEALVTVAVNKVTPEAADAFRDTTALQRHLRTDEGRAALSKSGKPESVEILDSFSTARAVYLRVRDLSRSNKKALVPEHWKAIFSLPEAAVSISVRGLKDGTLSPADGQSLVRDFVARTVSELDVPS